jgi:hypothetical protein
MLSSLFSALIESHYKVDKEELKNYATGDITKKNLKIITCCKRECGKQGWQ